MALWHSMAHIEFVAIDLALEARAFDVTPTTLERVRAMGDEEGVRILQRIIDDEIRHVAIGA